MLREFLIGLGFKIDDPSKKKFDSAIATATKQAVGLGEAVIAAATAVEVAVIRISRQFETLYWVSQRARSSVSNLQAFSSAAETVGISSDRSRSAIESLARAMRLNPGSEGLLNALGIQTKGRDTKLILDDFVKALEKYPTFVRAKFAQIAGQNPDDIEDLIRTRARREREEADYNRRRSAAGVDHDKLAKSVSDENGVGPKFTRFLQNVDILLQRVAIDFLPLANRVLDFFNDGAEALARFDKATNGWALSIGTVLVGALGAWIAKLLVVRFLLRGVAAEAAAAGAAAAGAGAGGAAAGGAAAGGAAAGAAARGGLFAGLLKFGLKFGGITTFLSTLLDSDPTNQGEDEQLARNQAAWRIGQGLPSTISGKTTLGMRNNNPGNMRSWGSTPRGEGGFARFSSAADGANAMAGNLLKYGERGWDTVSKIIGHWAPPSENDTGNYIGTVAGKVGVDPNQRLNLRDPAMLAKIMNAMIEVEQGGNPWGKDLAENAARSRLGGGVVLTAKTEINIAPGANSADTASRVERAQQRVNADLVRNMVGATR